MILYGAGTSKAVGLFAGRKLLRKHLKMFYWLLSAEDTRVSSSALHLLEAMVLNGATSSLAREVMSTFNFAFKPFLKFPYAKSKTEVTHNSMHDWFLIASSQLFVLVGQETVTHVKQTRRAYIGLVVAFLRLKDADIVSAALERKGFVTGILKVRPTPCFERPLHLLPAL